MKEGINDKQFRKERGDKTKIEEYLKMSKNETLSFNSNLRN
jgi:hypothetical protein